MTAIRQMGASLVSSSTTPAITTCEAVWLTGTLAAAATWKENHPTAPAHGMDRAKTLETMPQETVLPRASQKQTATIHKQPTQAPAPPGPLAIRPAPPPLRYLKRRTNSARETPRTPLSGPRRGARPVAVVPCVVRSRGRGCDRATYPTNARMLHRTLATGPRPMRSFLRAAATPCRTRWRRERPVPPGRTRPGADRRRHRRWTRTRSQPRTRQSPRRRRE